MGCFAGNVTIANARFGRLQVRLARTCTRKGLENSFLTGPWQHLRYMLQQRILDAIKLKLKSRRLFRSYSRVRLCSKRLTAER
jgi:hypothetical protein